MAGPPETLFPFLEWFLGHGASATDADANGKTVAAAVTSGWVRDLLDNPDGTA